MRTYNRLGKLMNLIAGVIAGIAASMSPFRRVTCRGTSWALKISTSTATGVHRVSTAMCGIRTWIQAGLLITQDIGRGLSRGDGPGWTRLRGAMRPFTTAVGHLSKADGAGCRDRSR